MTYSNKQIGIIAAFVVVAAIVAFFGLAVGAKANPLFFPRTVQTATASTTPTFLTAGTATSTLILDAFGEGQPKATDKAVFLLQAAASSTSSVYGVTVTYSSGWVNGATVDCVANPTLCDWYGDSISTAATTTTSLNTPTSYTWLPGTVATSSRAITIPTPTRFVRIQTGVTSANGAMWGQIVPQRQSN